MIVLQAQWQPGLTAQWAEGEARRRGDVSVMCVAEGLMVLSGGDVGGSLRNLEKYRQRRDSELPSRVCTLHILRRGRDGREPDAGVHRGGRAHRVVIRRAG